MKRRWLLAMPLLAACGVAGGHPTYVKCVGKGIVSGQSQIMVYGGSFNITADCGDGFEYEGRKFKPLDAPASEPPISKK